MNVKLQFSDVLFSFKVAKTGYTSMYNKYKGKDVPGHPNENNPHPTEDCMGCSR